MLKMSGVSREQRNNSGSNQKENSNQLVPIHPYPFPFPAFRSHCFMLKLYMITDNVVLWLLSTEVLMLPPLNAMQVNTNTVIIQLTVLCYKMPYPFHLTICYLLCASSSLRQGCSSILFHHPGMNDVEVPYRIYQFVVQKNHREKGKAHREAIQKCLFSVINPA